MSFNEYKSAEFWTRQMMETEEIKEISRRIEENDKQVSVFALIGWLFIGAAFFGALYFACFFDAWSLIH